MYTTSGRTEIQPNSFFLEAYRDTPLTLCFQYSQFSFANQKHKKELRKVNIFETLEGTKQ